MIRKSSDGPAEYPCAGRPAHATRCSDSAIQVSEFKMGVHYLGSVKLRILRDIAVNTAMFRFACLVQTTFTLRSLRLPGIWRKC